MKTGVCIIALGYELYGYSALNLSLSIKAYSPHIRVALLTDGKSCAGLLDEEKKWFDEIIIVDEADYTVKGGKKEYQRAKLCVDKYTPFDHTMVIDADTIWFDRRIEWLFGDCLTRGYEFYIGVNSTYNHKTKVRSRNSYTYWAEPSAICEQYKLDYLLQSVSGLFYFSKGDVSDRVFEIAREIYDEPNTINIPWAGGKPDEFCLNIAMSKVGVKLPETNRIYFRQTAGTLTSEQIYAQYWGLATGGARVDVSTVKLYNRLVDKYCIRLKIKDTLRHYHVDKASVIPERMKY